MSLGCSQIGYRANHRIPANGFFGVLGAAWLRGAYRFGGGVSMLALGGFGFGEHAGKPSLGL